MPDIVPFFKCAHVICERPATRLQLFYMEAIARTGNL